MSHENENIQSYALATGPLGAKRLNLQNDLLGEDSRVFLTHAGLKPGMTVIDMACGSGAMTAFLAKSVGPTGHVFAVDISLDQLAVAKEHIAFEQLTNVTFVQEDILNPKKLPKESADLIYGRFILMHLTNPLKAIMNMKDLLKPGGVVAGEEPIKKSNASSYETALFNEYIASIIALGKSLGLDYNIGERLAEIYQNAGFEITTTYQKQIQINSQEAKLMFSYALNEFQHKLIAAKVATPQKIADWHQIFAALPPDDKTWIFLLAKQTYLLAKKTV